MSSDSFLSTMTFASMGPGQACDCDECGVPLPLPLLNALREHKRRRLEQTPLKRTQFRELLRREPSRSVAVWKWMLPFQAEPLLEFGSSHRIVWVKNLPSQSKLQKIGQGIVGSSDEEKTRTDLNWKEDGIYLLPSNGGKAIGLIHESCKTSENSTDKAVDETDASEGGPVSLWIAKIPMSTPKDVRFKEDEDRNKLPEWTGIMVSKKQEWLTKAGYEKNFDDNMSSSSSSSTSSSSAAALPFFLEFSPEDQAILREAFLQAERGDSIDDGSAKGNNPPKIPSPAASDTLGLTTKDAAPGLVPDGKETVAFGL